jgi:hypothetical protein
VLFLIPDFCKNLKFSLSDHCKWGTSTLPSCHYENWHQRTFNSSTTANCWVTFNQQQLTFFIKERQASQFGKSFLLTWEGNLVQETLAVPGNKISIWSLKNSVADENGLKVAQQEPVYRQYFLVQWEFSGWLNSETEALKPTKI